MSEINFISNSGGANKNSDDKDSNKETKWTSPKKENIDSNAESFHDTFKSEKNNLENSQSLNIEKLSDKQKTGHGFFSLLKLFKKNNLIKQKVNGNKFKDDKELLARQENKITQEKEKRKNITENNDAKNTEAEEMNISTVIKKKLKIKKQNWDSARTVKTNLIKGEVTTFFEWKKNLTTLLVGVFLSIIIIGMAYGGLIYKEKKAISQEQTLDQEIENLNLRIEELNKQTVEIDKFQNKLNLVRNLLDNHIYWTTFFKFLENNTLKKVTYAGNFSGSTDGKYSFSAQADLFSTIDNQVNLLRQNEYVKEVSVESGTLSEMTVKSEHKDEEEYFEEVTSFNLNLEVYPKIFKKIKDKDN